MSSNCTKFCGVVAGGTETSHLEEIMGNSSVGNLQLFVRKLQLPAPTFITHDADDLTRNIINKFPGVTPPGRHSMGRRQAPLSPHSAGIHRDTFSRPLDADDDKIMFKWTRSLSNASRLHCLGLQALQWSSYLTEISEQLSKVDQSD